MSRLEVQKSTFKKEFETRNGPLRSYTVIGMLDGELEQVEMNAKSDATAPKAGDILEVTVEDTDYGKKAKKVQQGGYNGSSGGKSYTHKEDSPASDYPYLALKAAVEFGSAKVAAKHDIDGEKIVGMAKIFEKYLRGKYADATAPVIEYEDIQDIIPMDGEHSEGGI